MDATVARCAVNTSNSLIVAARIRCRRPIVGGFQLSAFCPSHAISGSGSGIRLCRRCGSSRLPFCSSSVSSTSSRSPLSSEPAGGSIGGCDERKVLGGGALRSLGPGATSFTAVLLGWLGAEHKHLKRYAEMYKSRGMHVTSLVIGPGDLLRVDLGKMVEQRIAGFARDLVSLVTEEGKSGKESCLLFHTFSNTGWLAYGAILDNLQSREDIIRKIKGCIVDSGGDPNINPKVWAAGFCAALLKRNSNSLTYPWGDSTKKETVHNSKSSTKQDGQYYLADMFFLTILETFFTFLLKLPDVKKRLERIITVLIEKQPLSPQLYLYSSADKVIPFLSVELFIEQQKAIGRNVHAYNFLFSPHVDHLRTFSDVYYSQVRRFLDECLPGTNSNSTP